MALVSGSPIVFPPLSGSVWFLSGPTASGKSAVALELAERLNAEILSLDSMAVYRGMDIGTAKPTAAEQARVPHHLLDLVEPAAEFSLAEYVAAAHAATAEVVARGRQPLFVGGTPLYLKALLRGLFTGPPADWELRRQLAAEEDATPGTLHARLGEVDPAAARKFHPRDQRRLIRGLEVFAQTGRPLSAWQQQFDQARPAEETRVFVLDWPVDVLRTRIEQRVHAMFAAGLLDEAARVAAAGPLSRTASQAVGYREALACLAGEYDQTVAEAAVTVATQQFAKRQRTWFRSLSECRRVPLAEPVDLTAVADGLLRMGAGPC